ncbi:hypothetical protein [Morganella morganii]|uniref:hypothetical protein n=1 Tax=Morganella morganii TaxID=582 RepID=UPI003BAEB16B
MSRQRKKYYPHDGFVSVQLDSGKTLNGQVLIAADGSHSAVAQQCGMQWSDTPYEQVAVIANVMTELDPQGGI